MYMEIRQRGKVYDVGEVDKGWGGRQMTKEWMGKNRREKMSPERDTIATEMIKPKQTNEAQSNSLCLSIYISHHYMIGPLSMSFDVSQGIDMAKVHIQERISRELCHLLPPGAPLIKYSI